MTYNEILVCNKHKEITDKQNMDGTQKQFTNQRQPKTKEYILYNSICLKTQIEQKYSIREKTSGFQELWSVQGTACNKIKDNYSCDGNVLYHNCGNRYITVNCNAYSSDSTLKIDEFYFI